MPERKDYPENSFSPERKTAETDAALPQTSQKSTARSGSFRHKRIRPDLSRDGLRKADKILIVLLLACAVLLLFPLLNYKEGGSYAVVKVRNEEKLRLPLSEDGEYSVEGALGTVHISIKNGKAAVTQENSPHHYCSRQGYVDSPAVPIVCLPNETIVTIEGSEAQEDTVIQ